MASLEPPRRSTNICRVDVKETEAPRNVHVEDTSLSRLNHLLHAGLCDPSPTSPVVYISVEVLAHALCLLGQCYYS